MAEASTDFLVDEDILLIEYSDTHVSKCVKIWQQGGNRVATGSWLTVFTVSL